LLESNQIELGIELYELLLNAVFEVCHTWFGPKKKWARPTSRYCIGTKSLESV
jgi:hypothetical protein